MRGVATSDVHLDEVSFGTPSNSHDGGVNGRCASRFGESAISRLSAHGVAVTTWHDDDSCTADASPFLSCVRLPSGVDSKSPIEVPITSGRAAKR